MYRIFYKFALAFTAAAALTAQPAFAQTPNDVLATIKNEAAGTPGFQGFSAARGESFFKATHGSDWSCASCHSDNPATPGKHAKTSKVIQPLAPAANAERFTDLAKVEKWFKRNCNDVLGRACTAQEKGDVLTYLLTIRK
jgi:hypothetical protein